jgi:hypothetical protein
LSIDFGTSGSTSPRQWLDLQIAVARRESGQLRTAVAAIKEKGVITGQRIERREIGASSEFDHLTDDECV